LVNRRFPQLALPGHVTYRRAPSAERRAPSAEIRPHIVVGVMAVIEAGLLREAQVCVEVEHSH
jgi:hypothetical protein